MELSSRLELPNLFLTKEVLYLLSYDSISTLHIIKDIASCVKTFSRIS